MIQEIFIPQRPTVSPSMMGTLPVGCTGSWPPRRGKLDRPEWADRSASLARCYKGPNSID